MSWVFCSVMDFKLWHYQIEMNDSNKPKAAFVCPFGFYEFSHLPLGITNALNTFFQRLMEKCIKDINLKSFCLPG